jgi:AraC family transcriptional regulator of adaptative response/methylated-DNA-[protein]-cysteine methyltransferase
MTESKRLALVGRAATDTEWAAIAYHRSQPRFFFIVTSTGIICTPGCPARLPGRDRVRVIADYAEGPAAGARACLRCHPDLAQRTDAPDGGAEPRPAGDPVGAAIARLTTALDAGDDVPTDRQLAGEFGLPERRLRESFRDSLGVTPRAWVAARRAEMMRSRLAGGQDVTGALYDAGYGSSSVAYQAANGELGMAPGRFRNGADGESIRWTIAPIPEGVALVAATARGLCAVRLGRAADGLEAELRREFPRATLARDDASLADLAALVSDLAAGRRRPDADTLPLDVHATAFRRRVWEALRRIPAGETRSYGQVAAAVGAPGAARAVGTACAQNPVAVVVPCHRVVGAHGSMGGYAYGLARKRQLLEAEASSGAGVASESGAALAPVSPSAELAEFTPEPHRAEVCPKPGSIRVR